MEQEYVDTDREEDDRRKRCVPVGQQRKPPNYLYDFLQGVKIAGCYKSGFEYAGSPRMQWRLIGDELKKVIEPKDEVQEPEQKT